MNRALSNWMSVTIREASSLIGAVDEQAGSNVLYISAGLEVADVKAAVVCAKS